MNIGKAVSRIKSDNKIFSDDDTLSDRTIWGKIKSYTFTFLKQRNDRNDLNNNNFLYQTLSCVEMEMVNSIDCCYEIPACKILRSKKPIPKIAESKFSSIMKGIYTLDTSERIDFITINDVVRLSKQKYPVRGIKAFIKNDYLYIPFRDTPRAVLIEAFFDDPEEVYKFNLCNTDTYCLSMQDMEWKIPSDIEAVVLQEVNKDISNFYQRIPVDENTNKNENI